MTTPESIELQRPTGVEARLWTAMAPLRSVVSFMNTGAHPDDETTSMLAALVLRDGLRVSIACSTRGEGGQNAIGTETVRDLGVIRTREMERSAEVLGMPMYWLSEDADDPIFDFGFSKSGEETLAKWGRDRLLARFVWALRTERPDIICPTFLDVPGQHGHHRAMTQAAFDAVKLAADPDHKDGLEPWQVAKLYLPAWSGAGDSYDDDEPPPPATVSVDGSGADAVLGAEYVQIGEWSRAYHKTQGMGRIIAPGEAHPYPLHLAWAATGNRGPEDHIGENLPQTLTDIGLPEAQDAIEAAFSAWPDREAIATHAATALAALREVPGHEHRVAAKRRQLARVVALARGIEATISVTPAMLRPGDTATIELDLPDIAGLRHTVRAPEGWRVEGDRLHVPEDAPPSNPMPDTWRPDRSNASVTLLLAWEEAPGQPIKIDVEPEEHPFVLPAAVAACEPSSAVNNPAAPRPIATEIRAETSREPSFACPAGWNVALDGTRATFTAPADPTPGIASFPLSIGGKPAHTVARMDYAHTGPLVRPAPAIFRVSTFRAEWPSARIAYIPGGSDRVDERLRAAGLEIQTLSGAAIDGTDLTAFDTILVGIFAARSNPKLAARMADIHQWVHAGGTLVTLYHRPWDNWDVMPVAPLTIGKPSLRWRVTDENAAVKVLEPENPIFSAPNAIGPQDWDGWQKERGLYFAADWDAAYRPLLEMADPDEAPHRGSLLEGRFGAGVHRHVALILHHQLDELVGGAYRLMANLLTPTA